MKLIELLQEKGAVVVYHDPYIDEVVLPAGKLTSMRLRDDTWALMDCVVLASPHACYDLERILARSHLVFDTQGVTKLMGKRPNLIRLGEP